MSSDPSKNQKTPKTSESVPAIIPSRSDEFKLQQKPYSTKDMSEHNEPSQIFNFCERHKSQKLVSVCTKCGIAMCPQCQVRDHADHIELTWNLENFLKQIEKQLHQSQPDTFELNDYLINFKIDIKNKKKQLVEVIDKVDFLLNGMIKKAKESFDKDIDDSKKVFNTQDRPCSTRDLSKKIQKLTQYYGIDPTTRKVYRKNAYRELYKWKTSELLMEQKEFFNTQASNALKLLQDVEKEVTAFKTPEIQIIEQSQFKPQSFEKVQKIEMAHANWIRSVQMFRLSQKEVQNLGIVQLAQTLSSNSFDGLPAIVTNSDDMNVKIWVFSPDDKMFHNLSSIPQAHSREFLSMRIQYCDSEMLSRMTGGETLCNNLIFTAEHGLIKIWDWISHKCVNEIKTHSVLTYDFEILRFPELGICYAQGSKNIIQISDFTSPGGMLKIKEINPQEQHRELTCLKKIPADQVDLLIVSFAGTTGVVCIYNHLGHCISRIVRQDKELAFCLEQVNMLKRSQKEQIRDVIVVGSDTGVLSAYTVHDGKTLWVNEQIHSSWVRGLASMVVRDSYYYKSLVLSTSQNELSIKIVDGYTGLLLYTVSDVLDSGLRFRGLACLQGDLNPQFPDSSIVVAGTINGTLNIFRILE